jgi:hypothetical protein
VGNVTGVETAGLCCGRKDFLDSISMNLDAARCLTPKFYRICHQLLSKIMPVGYYRLKYKETFLKRLSNKHECNIQFTLSGRFQRFVNAMQHVTEDCRKDRTYKKSSAFIDPARLLQPYKNIARFLQCDPVCVIAEFEGRSKSRRPRSRCEQLNCVIMSWTTKHNSCAAQYLDGKRVFTLLVIDEYRLT